MGYFTKRRNIELSTIEYLETSINASWSGITTVKSFLQAYATSVSLPVVCIRLASTENGQLEVGSTTLDSSYNIIIDIFAKSDGQRLDLADFIVDKLKDCWTYYTYSHPSNTNETLEKVAVAKIRTVNWVEDNKLDFFDTVESRDRFRHVISVDVKVTHG
jgi:hypothetical protein